ncbi:MAG: response regulator transcription factor [Planctomycetaceae bacterium]|nr:response regulator transcription factor [Planctomycetaceae bacterium]
MRSSLDGLLKACGYATVPFASAMEFLDQYSPDDFGCVIVDHQMPEMSGLELLERLFDMGELSITVLFITAYADVPTAVSAMKYGAIDFLEKPFERKELITKVEQALQREQVKSELRLKRTGLCEKFDRLSTKEMETLDLLRQGLPNKAIASQLNITERAVEMRRARMMEKLAVQTIASLFEEFADYRAFQKS